MGPQDLKLGAAAPRAPIQVSGSGKEPQACHPQTKLGTHVLNRTTSQDVTTKQGAGDGDESSLPQLNGWRFLALVSRIWACQVGHDIEQGTAKVTPHCPTNVSPPWNCSKQEVTTKSSHSCLSHWNCNSQGLLKAMHLTCCSTNTMEIAHIHGSSKLQHQHRHHVIAAQTACASPCLQPSQLECSPFSSKCEP